MSRQSKIDALQRLASPGSGATPSEREVAKTKLAELLAKREPFAEPDSQTYGRSPLEDWARNAQAMRNSTRTMRNMANAVTECADGFRILKFTMSGFWEMPIQEEQNDDEPLED